MHAPAAQARPGTTDRDTDHAIDLAAVALRIKALARDAGFQRCGISGVELGDDEGHLRDWLANGLHGSMGWMARHGARRARPAELVPGTLRVLSVGLDYGQDDAAAWANLAEGERAYVARYALGRDYHKLMRQRLQRLADTVAAEIGPFGHRVFVDSAPVLERALARNSGLGWIGKHTCLVDKDGGSWFFLGEIYLDLPLPVDPPAAMHCGTGSPARPCAARTCSRGTPAGSRRSRRSGCPSAAAIPDRSRPRARLSGTRCNAAHPAGAAR